jgi:hypothetical protein
MKLMTKRPRFGGMIATLPGPDRKRTFIDYRFRLTYRDPAPSGPGCLMVWEVEGGRLPYQVAVEQTDGGRLKWHCSCADAVYRGEKLEHTCKHVRGLVESLEAIALPVTAAAA